MSEHQQTTGYGYKRTVILLLVVILVLLGCIWKLVWKCSLERMDARAAWSMVMDYERMRGALDTMSVESTIDTLDIIVHAQPRLRNPHLNLIVQRERTNTIRYIIGHLRQTTKEDLGEDPEAWISRYQRR
jgi:hypothetical protein